jgi:uncharacterized protein (DUF2252 family)
MNKTVARGSSHSKRHDEPKHLAPDERRAQGKTLRDKVPREAHGKWKPSKDRRNLIDVLNESNVGRIPSLVPIRFGRMMQSPFAFFRGSAVVMAADLASTPTSGIRVQVCGDAHLSNFGGFATPERRIVFDINDFDETLPAPWEWDLKRLTASVVLAGRYLKLHESDTARAVVATTCSYRERMRDYASMHILDVWYDAIDLDRFVESIDAQETQARVQKRVQVTRAKNTPEFLFPKFVEHKGGRPRLMDDPPLIFHPTTKEAPALESQYEEQIALYRDSLPEHTGVLFDRYHFCDMALKVVGVGSVGTICGVALFMAADDDPIFLQLKEANASVLEPYAGKSLYPNHGQRVIAGQRLMQSASDLFLGWARAKNGRHFYVRQLRDMKMTAMIEGFSVDDLREYGRVCGWALARAHARSGDAAMIAGYLGSSQTFDDVITEFATEYADQAEHDYRTFLKAVRAGDVEAATEE